MAFTDEARQLIREIMPIYQEQLVGHIPRILVRDEANVEMERLRVRWRTARDSENNEIIQDYALGDLPNSVLLGSAGSGKSQILLSAFLNRCQRFLVEGAEPLPLYLDLGTQLPTDLNIANALARWSRGLFPRVSAEHPEGAILFFDSLDEVLRKTRDSAFYNNLRFFFEALPPSVSTFLACRSSFWNPTHLKGSKRDFSVFDCDYLDPTVYERLIPQDAERGRFFTDVRGLGIESMLESPFFGFELARSFLRHEPLPPTRMQWFDQQINRLLAGAPVDQERSDYVSVPRLALIAQHLACLESFSGTDSWTVSKAMDLLSESPVLSQSQQIQRTELEVLFRQRSLFKRAGEAFFFIHQLFREHLAAMAIRTLSLRKQRQLLEAPIGGPQHHILMSRRGIAMDLAEVSPTFRSHLITNDPLVAFMSEIKDLPKVDDERLTKIVIDSAAAQHHAPWWEMPPRGERPEDWLSRHCPRDKALFIRGYLQDPNEVARMWATTAIASWGGVPELNGMLIALAHDATQNTEIRRRAVEGVANSRVVADVQQLYDLLETKDDIVRGAVLDAYRLTEHPAPRDFIAKLIEPPHDVRLLCLLEIVPELYAQSLEKEQLEEAFAQADGNYSAISGFVNHLLRGLSRRALELNFHNIPASLVLKIWHGGSHHEIYFEKELHALLKDNWQVLASIWKLMLERSLDPANRGDLWHIETQFLEYCNDQIFELLPAENALSEEQKRFVEDVISGYFYKSPSPERLQLFRSRAASYTSRLRLPEETPPSAPGVTPDQIASILHDRTGNALQRTARVLSAITESRRANSGGDRIEVITSFLRQVPDSLKAEVLTLFEQCVEETKFARTVDANGQITITSLGILTPIWVMRALGNEISVNKRAEIIRCYGLDFEQDRDRMIQLLDSLETQDHAKWDECLNSLANMRWANPSPFLDYLIQRRLDNYILECRERLLKSNFDGNSYDALLTYWVARCPPDCADVLQQTYLNLRQRRWEPLPQAPDGSNVKPGLELPRWGDMRPLLALAREDIDWAWQELHERIRRGDVPLNDHDLHMPFYREIQFPLNSTRLPVLADWYALIRRHSNEDRIETLGQLLLETIIQIDGEDAVAELLRLIREQAFPGVEWLSHSIMRVEDRQLQSAEQSMPPGEMLDFVTRETLGVVQDSRDLFEWTCQAIEEIKEGIELRAEQVIGYWDDVSLDQWRPKQEVPCQTILWPMLRTKLEQLRVLAVEERQIAANSADFWVEKVLGHGNARVIIELKTAREGYTEAALIDPLRDQLWDRYLRPTQTKYGVFVVLWFKHPDHYPYPHRWETKEEYEHALESARSNLASEHNLNLACYVIDMTTMPRLH